MAEEGIALELALVGALILVNGFFAAAEMAVVSARRSRLQVLADEGDGKAALALRLKADPDRFLATVQVGVTLVGTLALGPDSVSANASFSGPRRIHLPLVTSLTIPVTFHAGTPARVEFFLGYESAPGADLTEASIAASYGVIGLPPGVRAIACYGADVTPVRSTTWGSLKGRYR